jgi:hypothetical protein
MGSENDTIIEAAVEAFRLGLLGATLQRPELQATVPRRDDGWTQSVRLVFDEPRHELRVRPMGDDGAEVEVIEADDVISACQSERGYTSADDLRVCIERIYAATRSPRS